MVTHLFEIKLKDTPRTTTRNQWKEQQKWLRICRNLVEQKWEKDKIVNTVLYNLMLSGSLHRDK